ncbi:hypothetical protein Cni_G24558 [Canna indica]|uniref:Uncharacterized protein n=1 Tax=Canna indica TaxID=4628 RepID=A0AAQ3KVA9_9LILI|nr:hypothetical protein Cni_G24558 [Canna indica]
MNFVLRVKVPGIENDRRQQIDEKQFLIKRQDVRALPSGNQQRHETSKQALKETTYSMGRTDKNLQNISQLNPRRTRRQTRRREAMDSLAQRMPSRMRPMRMQAQRRATKTVTETTEEVEGGSEAAGRKKKVEVAIAMGSQRRGVSPCGGGGFGFLWRWMGRRRESEERAKKGWWS